MRAAQYVRMSTEHQQYSIPNQIAAISEYAKIHGLEVVRTYSDEGRSGRFAPLLPQTFLQESLGWQRPTCGDQSHRSTSTTCRQPVKLDYFRVADNTPGILQYANCCFVAGAPFSDGRGRRARNSQPVSGRLCLNNGPKSGTERQADSVRRHQWPADRQATFPEPLPSPPSSPVQ